MKGKLARGIAMSAVVAVLGSLSVWLLTGCPATAQDRAAASAGAGSVPEGAGLAAKYPGDVGLEKDPAVIFAEGFEGGQLPTVGYEELGGFYDLKGYPKEMCITDKEAAVGKHSLELVHPAGIVSPQWLYRKFPGQDAVYVRFYRKYERDWAWPPLGAHDTLLFAGRYDNPASTDLTLYLDIPQGPSQRVGKGNWDLSRQPELVLKSSFQGAGLDFGLKRAIVSHVGWDNYYSLPYNIKPAPVLEGGRWYCFEYMAKMNSAPDKKDGEVRLWVDGELITETGAFTFRKGEWTEVEFKAAAAHSGWAMEGASMAGSLLDNLKLVFQGEQGDKFLIDDFEIGAGPAGDTPGQVVFAEKFDEGPGHFGGGEVADGGVDGSKAYCFGPKGCWIWDAFSAPVDDSTTIRFKLKPLCDADEVTVLVWSKKLNLNCRYYLTGLLLRNATRGDIKWDRWMLGPRYGGRDPDGQNRGAPREQRSWIDAIVLSTGYIGPAIVRGQDR